MAGGSAAACGDQLPPCSRTDGGLVFQTAPPPRTRAPPSPSPFPPSSPQSYALAERLHGTKPAPQPLTPAATVAEVAKALPQAFGRGICGAASSPHTSSDAYRTLSLAPPRPALVPSFVSRSAGSSSPRSSSKVAEQKLLMPMESIPYTSSAAVVAKALAQATGPVISTDTHRAPSSAPLQPAQFPSLPCAPLAAAVCSLLWPVASVKGLKASGPVVFRVTPPSGAYVPVWQASTPRWSSSVEFAPVSTKRIAHPARPGYVEAVGKKAIDMVGAWKRPLLVFVVLFLLTGVTSARPVRTSALCPTRNFASYLIQGQACHVADIHLEDIEVPSKDQGQPQSPQPSQPGESSNKACKILGDIFLIFGCIAPWYSISRLEPHDGRYIQFFYWRRDHVGIWRDTAISSILYYVAIMLVGLSFTCSEKYHAIGKNIFIVNAVCAGLFLMLLLWISRRYGLQLPNMCAVVGGLFVFALFIVVLWICWMVCAAELRIMIYECLGMILLFQMHILRWFTVNFSGWFVLLDTFGTISGFLWLCNRDGGGFYGSIIIIGAGFRIVEIVTSLIWCLWGGNYFVRLHHDHAQD